MCIRSRGGDDGMEANKDDDRYRLLCLIITSSAIISFFWFSLPIPHRNLYFSQYRFVQPTRSCGTIRKSMQEVVGRSVAREKKSIFHCSKIDWIRNKNWGFFFKICPVAPTPRTKHRYIHSKAIRKSSEQRTKK